MSPTQTIRRFDDHVAIVTGAGGGIGAAISSRFAEEGARVLVCDADDAAAKAVAEKLAGRGLLAEAR
ncbi:SDR family NAD(P)-dependent oxidoreductase, partial [Rhodococcus sp. NPDC057014]|uniref:SDR family NAD(P)-dependent oxidoreductase n=1 Tax=Rhodococcus sp. NPDC057014 TaxID=3346000 RepID=UPI00362A777F